MFKNNLFLKIRFGIACLIVIVPLSIMMDKGLINSRSWVEFIWPLGGLVLPTSKRDSEWKTDLASKLNNLNFSRMMIYLLSFCSIFYLCMSLLELYVDKILLRRIFLSALQSAMVLMLYMRYLYLKNEIEGT